MPGRVSRKPGSSAAQSTQNLSLPAASSSRLSNNATDDGSIKSSRSSRGTESTRDSESKPSRKSTRTSAIPISIPDEGPSTALRVQICSLFGDAQRTTAAHRKLVISLRKIQEACCYEPTSPVKGKQVSQYHQLGADFGEEEFTSEVARCMLRILGVKRSENAADRVIRFLVLFLRHANEKDNALLQEVADEDDMLETPSSRLTSHLLTTLLPLMTSKEKTVRFRATQITSDLVSSLQSIDFDIYQATRAALLRRIRDKESMVRVQAVLGLSSIASNDAEDDQEDEEEDDEDDASSLLEKLLDALQNDPSADVRRSLLLSLPLTAATLPYLLERARDLDAATRRGLYSRLLPSLADFRHLSLSMREKLLRWGLRDRDQNVRRAAARVFRERWIEDCAGTRQQAEGGAVIEQKSPSFEGLTELLERIDVVNSGVESGIAQEAMKEFWEGRPDYRAAVTFDDSFWENLTAEGAFMARSFNAFCRQEGDGKYENLVEEKMPEVTKLAFYIQRYTNVLFSKLKTTNERAEGDDEDTVELEFIVEQLLHIALTLDYTDEVGRRKMYALMREILAVAELPEETTRLVVDILRVVCGENANGERDFCGVVLEAVAEVHDTIMGEDGAENGEEDGEESFHSARSEVSDDAPAKKKAQAPLTPEEQAEKEAQEEEKAVREIVVNMKCLHIAQCMLQNVQTDLKENAHLVTTLNNLIVPAVRSHEAPIRERGLVCLGLCCLLDKSLAEENLILFLHCFAKGHEALQTTSVQIITDILTTHPSLLSPTPPTDPEAESTPSALQKPILKLYSRSLRSSSTDVQSTGCTALCKLMLGNVIKEDDLLKQLVLTYFDPATQDNPAMRQALTYFLPVYCHSRRENMERMARIAVPLVHALVTLNDELEEDEGMVGLTLVTAHLVDWTDPRKLVVLDSFSTGWDELGRKETKPVEADIHVDVAVDVLNKVLSSGCTKEERKTLISLLSKLYIAHAADASKLLELHDLAAAAVDASGRIAPDATSRNALTKVLNAVEKVVQVDAEQAEQAEPVVTAGEEDESKFLSKAGSGDEEGVEESKADEESRAQLEGESQIKYEHEDEHEDDGDDDAATVTGNSVKDESVLSDATRITASEGMDVDDPMDMD